VLAPVWIGSSARVGLSVRDDRNASTRSKAVAWGACCGPLRSADPAAAAMFQKFSMLSAAANADAIPVVSFVVVPLNLAGVVLPFDLVLYAGCGVRMAACGPCSNDEARCLLAVWQQPAPCRGRWVGSVLAIAWLLLPRRLTGGFG